MDKGTLRSRLKLLQSITPEGVAGVKLENRSRWGVTRFGGSSIDAGKICVIFIEEFIYVNSSIRLSQDFLNQIFTAKTRRAQRFHPRMATNMSEREIIH
jgi:hypothetical protein